MKNIKIFFFVFHTTTDQVKKMQKLIIKEDLKNCTAIANEKIKYQILYSSIFAVTKSGTISLEVCNLKIPSVIIYKMSKINFFIIKMLVKVRFANIINIAANKEVIPELLQSKCNSTNIFNSVDKLLNDKKALEDQVNSSQIIINEFKTENSSKNASSVLSNYL